MIEGFGLFFAVTAYTILSTGLMLMKKGVGWIGYGRPRDMTYFKLFFIWAGGFFLVNVSVVPNALALRHLDSHIVSAMAGWGVVVLVFLSYKVLNEKLFRSDIVFSFIIMVSIVFLNIYERRETPAGINEILFAVLTVIPMVFFVLALRKKWGQKFRAVFFAASAGMSAGMIVVTLKILVLFFGFKIPLYFSSGYFYLYLLFSLAAFIFIQFAYKAGSMLLVGPVQYSATILYPAVCSALVFGKSLRSVQIASLILLVYAVVSILKKH